MAFTDAPPSRQHVRRVIGGDLRDPHIPDHPGQDHPALHPVAENFEEFAETGPQEPDTDSVEQARRDGFEQGRREGFEAGREDGFNQGRQEGLEAAEQALKEHMAWEKAEIEVILSALMQPLKTLKNDIAESVIEGAQSLADLMVACHIQADTDALNAVLSEILSEAAEMGGPGQKLLIRVSPDSRETIGALADEYGAELVADETLNAGDCRVTLAKDNGDPVNKIEWDATLRARWNAIRKALGLEENH